ncbi:MAG: saccharopine dehydrogenase family protein [Actinomycetota bacterium]
MADILLFGATGYTGRLTAAALSRTGISFSLCGRDRAKLEALSAATGGPEVRVAEVGDVASLVAALEDCKVLITCVGPFVELGDTAVEAALQAKVHYIDSTGEGIFIRRLIDTVDARARAAGIAVAPALGFDEVPGDVAATLAAEGLDRPALDVTYAFPSTSSAGTARSALGIITSPGVWVEAGARREIRAGQIERWAPMPPPLGPKRALSFPLALAHLAPLHLDVDAFRTYVTSGGVPLTMARIGIPLLRAVLRSPARPLVDKLLDLQPEGPDDSARASGKWTILAEARTVAGAWRNVSVMGTDVYGLTAATLARSAVEMASPGYDRSGVLSPVGALGVETLRDELARNGVSIETYEPS